MLSPRGYRTEDSAAAASRRAVRQGPSPVRRGANCRRIGRLSQLVGRERSAVSGKSSKVFVNRQSVPACPRNAGAEPLLGPLPTPYSPLPSTVKLSPQPHAPVTLGLRKTKAAFSPWRAKSISVPSTSGRLCEIGRAHV